MALFDVVKRGDVNSVEELLLTHQSLLNHPNPVCIIICKVNYLHTTVLH